MTTNFEIWKPVKGFENIYEASSEGNIRPVNPRYKTTTTLKGGDNGRGHRLVVLCKDKRKKSYQVSRLVYEAFYGDIPEGLEIDHIDEDTRNNKLSNLQAVTHQRNTNRGTARERSAHDHRKAVRAFKNGEEVAHFASLKEAGVLTGLQPTAISEAAKGKRESVGGYSWQFAESPRQKPKKLYELQ